MVTHNPIYSDEFKAKAKELCAVDPKWEDRLEKAMHQGYRDGLKAPLHGDVVVYCPFIIDDPRLPFYVSGYTQGMDYARKIAEKNERN